MKKINILLALLTCMPFVVCASGKGDHHKVKNSCKKLNSKNSKIAARNAENLHKGEFPSVFVKENTSRGNRGLKADIYKNR
jgi:hypothetical protein